VIEIYIDVITILFFYFGNTILRNIETSRNEQEYDEQGNTVKSVYYDDDGEETSRTEQEYDERGNQTMSVYYSDGEETSRTEREYDDNGNMTKIITYTSGVKTYETIYSDFVYITIGNDGTPIKETKKPKAKMLFKSTIVSDKMKISLDGYRDVNFVVYDFAGNIVSEGVQGGDRKATLTWDLRNRAGRFVANGTYLIVVEAKDKNGNPVRYSAKLGVKR
jgi:hypothetical protein